MSQAIDIAVIGAGLAGLSCAQALHAAGRQVHIFDKARGAGGRMATRRTDKLSFDHGAQYFTARDASFQAEVAKWQAQGQVQPWQGRFAAWDGQRLTSSGDTLRFVGVPGMSSLCRSLLQGLDFTAQQRLSSLRQVANGWLLRFEDRQELQARQVVLALPAPQVALLLPAEHRAAAIAGSVAMSPCWAAMLQLDRALDCPFDGLFVNSGPLSWAARDSSKPGRRESGHTGGEAWVLHATTAWTNAHIDDTQEQAAAALAAAFSAIVGQKVVAAALCSHRWRYALADAPLDIACIHEMGLGVAGDWLHGSRVEGAWLSGQALAARMLATS